MNRINAEKNRRDVRYKEMDLNEWNCFYLFCLPQSHLIFITWARSVNINIAKLLSCVTSVVVRFKGNKLVDHSNKKFNASKTLYNESFELLLRPTAVRWNWPIDFHAEIFSAKLHRSIFTCMLFRPPLKSPFKHAFPLNIAAKSMTISTHFPGHFFISFSRKSACHGVAAAIVFVHHSRWCNLQRQRTCTENEKVSFSFSPSNGHMQHFQLAVQFWLVYFLPQPSDIVCFISLISKSDKNACRECHMFWIGLHFGFLLFEYRYIRDHLRFGVQVRYPIMELLR